jgi:hypothetical protein
MLAGCATTAVERESEVEARRQLELARTLETASQFREAAHEYSIVAEQFRGTTAYPVAVRKAACLYANPANPGRNDSTALRWLNTYLELPLSSQERENAQLLATLLERSRDQEGEILRQTAVSDSLTLLLKRQSTLLSSQAKRTQELEGELQTTAKELKKLKEVDVRISKDHRKK